MPDHIVWSCGAARRDKIICIERLDDGRYELELEDAVPCAVLAAEDGVEVLRQLREPTAKAAAVAEELEQVVAELRAARPAAQAFDESAEAEVVRRGQPLPGGFFAEEPSGKNSTADTVDVSVSPVVGASWPGSAATPEAFSVLVDTDTVRWAAVLPHAAARGLIRELESYLKLHS